MPRHASLRSSMKVLGAAALVATTALAQSDGPSLEKLEKYRRDALARAKQRLPSAQVEGVRWYWPAGENPASLRHAG